MSDWGWVSMLAGIRLATSRWRDRPLSLWTHRALVFELREAGDAAGRLEIAQLPQLMRADDPELGAVGFWRISARPLSL